MPIAYPSIITPGQQRVFFAPEPSYGVPPATYAAAQASGTSAWVALEPMQSVTSAIQRTPYEARENTGVPADLFDMIETTHHTTITLNTTYRSNGIAAWALAALCGSLQGGATDTITSNGTGSPPFATTPPAGATTSLHTIVPNNLSNVTNTFTIWHDQGDAQFVGAGTRTMLQMSAATVDSIRLTFTPNTALMAEITLQANFPVWNALSGASTFIRNASTVPTGYIKLGSDAAYLASRSMGFQGVNTPSGAPTMSGTWGNFNIMSSNGRVYPNRILSGDITISRGVEVIESPFSQNPSYYLPGPIAVTGTFDFLYDGIGDINSSPSTTAQTIMQDYLNFSNVGQPSGGVGTAGAMLGQNEIRYVDSDGNGFDLIFYPIKWTSFAPNLTEQSAKVNAGFTSFNSLKDAQVNNKISALRQVQLLNNISFAMIA
jgi:hypothetical protein